MRNELIKLNFIPIKLSADKFNGFRLPYDCEQQLNDLREQERDFIFRRNANMIDCIPIVKTTKRLGENKTFYVKDNLQLAENLVHSGLIRFFQRKNVSFSKIYPIQLILEKENLATNLLKESDFHVLFPIFASYEISSRAIVPHNGPVIFGLSISFGVKFLVQATVEDLINRGVDIRKFYVETDIDESILDARLASKYRRVLAGRVTDVNGMSLKLDDFKDSPVIDAGLCYLEPTRRNLNHCVASLYPQYQAQIAEGINQQIFRIRGGKNQYERLERLRKWLAKSPIDCCFDLSFTVSSQTYAPREGLDSGCYTFLTVPDYILRPGGSITVRGRIDSHIDHKGPYDSESFPRKRPTISVVFPDRFRGAVEIFIKQFKEGVSSNRKNVPFLQGFQRKYRLTGCQFTFFPIKDEGNSSAYREASLQALRGKPSPDLALVVINESSRGLVGDDSPYLVSKSTFMSQGVAVQEVEIETIRDDRGRPWILNNLALAVYAKMGGIPWVLSSTPSLTHELIFGIGSANVQTRRLSGAERVIGITTVFNGDGNYLLYNLSKEVNSDEYADALLKSLQECLNEVKTRYAWQAKDRVRLIFHQAFKRFKDIEVATVKQFVNGITEFEVEYAFVHLNKNHSWNIFDARFDGVQVWENNQTVKKGEFVPLRGCCVPLGPHAALLSLIGPYQLKTSLQGLPSPVLISLHRESTFLDQTYLVNQIFKLTFMSWRSFSPSIMPVTIEYSNMIAFLMGHLRSVNNWNPDILQTKLRESRWFL